uniref:Uncharacterized protein n=1 Tax=Anopheles coluzzii TaxID=1518534 RepID=A0A8W7Q1J4_ANOCL
MAVEESQPLMIITTALADDDANALPPGSDDRAAADAARFLLRLLEHLGRYPGQQVGRQQHLGAGQVLPLGDAQLALEPLGQLLEGILVRRGGQRYRRRLQRVLVLAVVLLLLLLLLQLLLTLLLLLQQLLLLLLLFQLSLLLLRLPLPLQQLLVVMVMVMVVMATAVVVMVTAQRLAGW